MNLFSVKEVSEFSQSRFSECDLGKAALRSKGELSEAVDPIKYDRPLAVEKSEIKNRSHENGRLESGPGPGSTLDKLPDKKGDAEKAEDWNGSAENASKREGIKESEPPEKRKPTPEEINEKQGIEIKEGLQRLSRGEILTTEEKGNLCEMMMDQYYISRGYAPKHSEQVTSLNDKGHQGIDGVYEKDGKFIIADAKFGSAMLKETQDGTQMSKEWINNRLDAAVGGNKALEIMELYIDITSAKKAGKYGKDVVK